MLPTTFSYLMADMQRAMNLGHKSLDISVADLAELLPLAEAGMSKERAARPVKHAGWIRPGDLRDLRGNGKTSVRIKRRSSPRSNLELFFCDNITEKERESEKLVLQIEAREAEIKAEAEA